MLYNVKSLSRQKAEALGGRKLKSFTLIELMVVITIILILSAFAIYNLGPARAKARDNKRISDVSLVANALDQYYTSNLRQFPTVAVNSTYGAVQLTNIKDQISPYINEVPVDPTNDGTYKYTYVFSTDGKSAAIVADKMENGQCNAIANINDPNLPKIIQAYLGKLGTDVINNHNSDACYYIARENKV